MREHVCELVIAYAKAMADKLKMAFAYSAADKAPACLLIELGISDIIFLFYAEHDSIAGSGVDVELAS